MTELAQDVVERACRGDADACREILERLHRPVIATIHRFLGSRFRADVEDIAQDVFLKVFRNLARFEPERGVKFTTWVYTFVRNHCFDVLKKRRLPVASLAVAVPGSSRGSGGSRDGAPPDLPDRNGRLPADAALQSELGRKIEEALATLGDDQRLAFVLREYEGLEYAAIAAVTGVSEGTVKSRLHRAKESLRLRLAPYLRNR